MISHDIKKISSKYNPDTPLTKWDRVMLWWYDHEPSFVRSYKSFVGSVRMRFFVRTYRIDTRLDRWNWHDTDERMLHGMMRLLVEFVEGEDGLNHCDWDDDDEHARVRKEIVAIYEWWKDYPIRISLIGMATQRWHEAKFGKNTSFEDHIAILNSPDSDVVKKLMDIRTEMSSKLESEEEDMMIRLVRIKGHLWT